jgi:hypothetical protein
VCLRVFFQDFGMAGKLFSEILAIQKKLISV